tara:strand:- start:670 stop:1083 length:414 start_codon:yes stop_codon:yes gene_type:complete
MMLVQLLDPDPILLDDPVRPRISPKRKVSPFSRVYMWLEEQRIGAVVCCSFRFNIPKSERELFQVENYNQDKIKIILYSIWSYEKGCGQKLVQSVLARYRVHRVITMSPKTDMARDFHLRNGAKVLQVNRTTVNYEY